MMREKQMSRTFVDPSTYEGRSISVQRWGSAPWISTVSPDPSLHPARNTLFVAYNRGDMDDPGFDVDFNAALPFAILQFDGVTEHYIGPPNAEALHLHPLYSAGLRKYAMFKIVGSPKATGDLQHWILTFHNETVEVVAASACVAYAGSYGEKLSSVVDPLIANVLARQK